MSQDELLSRMIGNNNEVFITIGAEVYRVYADKRGYHIKQVLWDASKPHTKIAVSVNAPIETYEGALRVPIATYRDFGSLYKQEVATWI